ncbi:hypothetical protein [Mitsuaria sp. 7]|uniref:hypothetical protein n=1 Tax=Mitsuaria sp. 7 TaxID=1658665 RepID=UPI0007DD42D6|nr:hypothetical protein [Mitsuaria sp. 7]ANH67750.1 hypothetical protein ABE85_09495 [Mitsuaria sp. 7]
MRFNSKSIANFFLDLAATQGERLDPMKLQKLVGAFLGKDWTPAVQVTAILLFIFTCAFVYTIGNDPDHFTDLQKALLAFMSSGLAFLWGRVGK